MEATKESVTESFQDLCDVRATQTKSSTNTVKNARETMMLYFGYFLLILLSAWGAPFGYEDLLTLLAAWGARG